VHEAPQRIEQFKADVAEMRIHDPSSSRDQLVARAALAGMAIGVILPIIGYALSHGTTNALQQRDAIVLSLIGVSVAIASSALYLRAALAGFLRFWLLRDIHERRAQTDRLVASAGEAGTGAEPARVDEVS
jgi:hypothetical protein